MSAGAQPAGSGGARRAVLAIDQGGSATRVALLGGEGEVLHLARRAVQTHRGEVGEVTHDAMRLVGDLDDALDVAIAASRDLGVSIAAAGLSCQRASVVAFDRVSGEALSDVLSWQDTRAASLLAAAKLDVLDVLARTGMFPTAFHGASKLRWLAQTVRAEGSRIMLAPLASFLIARLTGVSACPATIAQRTLLFDRHAADWDDALIDRFALARSALPPVRPDMDDFGVIRRGGLEIPLTVAAGDQNLLVAARALDAANGLLNLGTGAFLLVSGQGIRAPARIQASLAPGRASAHDWFVEATVHGAAAAFDWLAAQALTPGPLPWAALDDASDDDPHFANAVGGIGSPWWVGDRPPRFSEPPRDAGAAIRSVSDGLAGLLRVNLDALHALGATPKQLTVSGGLTRHPRLLQRIADTLDVALQVEPDAELSLRGLWHLLTGRAPEAPSPATVIAPGPDRERAYRRYRQWRDFMARWDARCVD